MRNLAKRHPGAVIIAAVIIYIVAGIMWHFMP